MLRSARSTGARWFHRSSNSRRSPGKGSAGAPSCAAARGEEATRVEPDDCPGDARGRLLFLHGTRPAGSMSPPADKRARGVGLAALGILAISQRSYVTLWRQPVLIVSTMLFPIVYLLILGNALNRQLRAIPLAVVTNPATPWPRSACACHRARGSRAGATFCGSLPWPIGRRRFVGCAGESSARCGCFPSVSRGRDRCPPSIGGYNTDRFSFDTMEAALSEVWDRASTPGGQARAAPGRPAGGLSLPGLPDLPRARGRVSGHLHGLHGVGRPAGHRGSDVRVSRRLSRDSDLHRDPGGGTHPGRFSRGGAGGRHGARRGPDHDSHAGGGSPGGPRIAPHDLSHVPRDRLGVVPGLRPGAARERAARRLRDHQRAAFFPVGALSTRSSPIRRGCGRSRTSTR